MTTQEANITINRTEFVAELYQSVDARSIERLSTFLADNVNFQFANAPSLQGKAAVLDVNATFFKSIASMSHRIDNVWGQGDDIICNGPVTYTRLDGSHFAVPFATVLTLQRDQIVNYLIYVDVSEL